MQKPIQLLLPMPLDAKLHDREAFSCGVSELDTFLKTRARKEAEQNLNKTFVLTRAEKPQEIIGYYTLSTRHIPVNDMPAELSKRLPRYNHLGVTLLGRFAIAEKYQSTTAPKQSLGALLLTDVKLRTYKAAQSVASFGLLVDVLVGEKGDPTGFYLKYDFQRFPHNQSRLFLPMKTIEKTLRAANLID